MKYEGLLVLSVVLGCSSSSQPVTGAPPADSGAIDSPTTQGDGGIMPAPEAGGDGGGGGDTGTSTSCAGKVPLVYNAPTDRAPHQANPPSLGGAGTTYLDPTYGTKVLRLTDVNTVAGANLSYRVANEFWGNDWNVDSTRFYIQGSNGGFLLYDFDPKALTATRVPDMANAGSPLKMPLGPGGFSRLDPALFYGLKGLTLAKFDFTTQTETDLVDLTTIVPGATGYALSVEEGGNGLLATSFGGPQQDKMPYVATWDPKTGMHHVVDVTKSTLDGAAIGATIGGGVHTVKIDASGQYLTFSVTGGSSADWVWDTSAGTVQTSPSGGSLGWAAWIHGGGSTDSYQWQLSTFAAPSMSTPLITPLLTPMDKLESASLSWQNAVAGSSAPFIVETMRQPADTGPLRAWDEEVIAVRTDGMLVAGEGGAPETEVWRFAHTFNTYTGTVYSDNYYYLFIPRVSQDGQFVIFDSNWNQTLGTDATGNPRTDVLIAALPNPCAP